MELIRIGTIHTPFRAATGTPIQPCRSGGAEGFVEVDEPYDAAVTVVLLITKFPPLKDNPVFGYTSIGAAALPVAPAGVSWSETIHEWVLPYETVRAAVDPVAELTAFFDALYALCGTAAGWDINDLSYVPPPRAARG